MDKRMEKIGLFIGLTFLVDWLMIAAFVFTGGTWNTPNAVLLATVYMFVPMISALVVQKFYKQPIKKPLGIAFKFNRKWFLIAWFLPVIISVASFSFGLLFPGVEFSPGMEGMFERFESFMTPSQVEEMKRQMIESPVHPFWIGIIQGLAAGISINAVAGFGEELGWRGFLQREFGFMNFWRASLIIGLIWGVWHAPLILQGHNYPQHPVIGVFMMIVWAILLSPIFSYVRIKSGTVLAAAVIHGTLNATYGLSILLVKGGSDLIVGTTGLAGFIVLIIINGVIFRFDPSINQKVSHLLEN